MMIRRRLSAVVLTCTIASAVLVDSTWAGGRVQGYCHYPRIAGNLTMGYRELYEFDLFLSPSGHPPVGPSCRTGAMPGGNTYDGWYYFDNMPQGKYSLLLDQPEFYIVPTVVPNVYIWDGLTTFQDVVPAVDYSTFFVEDQQWTGPDSAWYQTFTATGTSVTAVTFFLAGTSAASADVSILKDNGNADIRAWTEFTGAKRRVTGLKANSDNFARWRSGQIPLIPGTRYAVKVAATSGGFQPYKRDRDGNSYAGGRAYNSAGQMQNFDLNFTVFVDLPNKTVITVNSKWGNTGDEIAGNYDLCWGQTFTARGAGLASVDVWAAGDTTWDRDFSWIIRDGGPTGTQIGPLKVTKAAFFGAGVGLHGVSYSPNEVNLTAGHTYFIQFSNPYGFNPHMMRQDSYDGGTAHRLQGSTWNAYSRDLAMTIVEYAQPTPLMEVLPLLFEPEVYLGENPQPDYFTVRNTTGGTLCYTITVDVPWITVTPLTGCSSGQTDVHTVTYSAGGLARDHYPATITVTPTQPEGMPATTISVSLEVVTVMPDSDGDAIVDQKDFGYFQRCFTGPGIPQNDPACLDARLDNDEDVDQEDFTIFQRCLSGAGNLSDRDCAAWR